MLFRRSFFCRVLTAYNFDQKAAFEAMQEYIVWRHSNQIDMLMEDDILQHDEIKEFFPNGFHECDKDGRPIFFVNVGQIKLTDLLQHANSATVTKFLIKELEHTWREKFDKVEEVTKKQADQIRVVLDLKGATLKSITNKQFKTLFKELVIELSKRFPNFVHAFHLINTPIFFENVYNAEIKHSLSPGTIEKIEITGESAPKSLTDNVEATALPTIYGGSCNCKA